MLKKLSQHTCKKKLAILANGIFYSKLEYALPLIASTWNLDVYKDAGSKINNFSKEDCRKLQVLQNEVCRILLGKHHIYFKQSLSTEELLHRLDRLSIHQLGVYSTVMLVKKSIIYRSPGYFMNKLKNKDQSSLRTCEKLCPLNVKLNLSRSSFFYRGIKLFNSLPSVLQEETSLTRFQIELKKWICKNISIKP